MDGLVDVVYVLSIFAAAAALWFRWSSARAGKRALELIRRDAPTREPGLKLEVLAVRREARTVAIDVRITNPVGVWNLIAALFVEAGGAKVGAGLLPPVVIGANDSVETSVSLSASGESHCRVVLVDIDDRRVEIDVQL